MYEEIKKNIVERFMINHYLWTCWINQNALIKDIQNRIPFNVKYLDPNCSNCDSIELDLGDNVSININFKWEQRVLKNSLGRDFINYRLISIS